ncbi:hypothetical protein PHMEG_00032517, partial [Phytophthora megakarya]
MLFGLKNAPMIYQRMIDNALWGFVQPQGGWKKFADKMRMAEVKLLRRGNYDSKATDHTTQTKFNADRDWLLESDPVLRLVNTATADMFATNEPDQSALVPVFQRRSFVDDVCFGGTTFDDCLDTLDKLLMRFEECRISVSFTKNIFCQSKVDFSSHEVSSAGIRADVKKITAITELPFPKSKKGGFAVFGAVLYQLKDEDFTEEGDLSGAKESFRILQRKVAEAPILRHFDKAKEVYVMLYANEWALSATLMQMHDDKLHPVRFCGRVLKDAEMNYHSAEKEVLALLLMLKTCYTQLAGKKLHVFDKLLHSTITNFVDLDDSLALVAPPTKGSPNSRLDPSLLYAQLPVDYCGYVLSFDGSAKTEKNGGYGSCSWILWKLPDWQIVIPASAYLETTTVNMAEYTGTNNGVQAALEFGVDTLVIVGDSRPAIQQSLGVIACRKDSLITLLNRHRELTAKFKSVGYLHVIRQYNAAADSLGGEALESKVSKVVLSDHRKLEPKELNRIQEMVYDTSADNHGTEASDALKSVHEHATIAAVTRSQTTSRKRVHFEDEQPVEKINATPELETTTGTTRKEPTAETARLSAELQWVPNAEDIDPITIQEERRRRIAVAQDEEQRWSMMKTVLRGDTRNLMYKEAREAWKWADKF